MAAGLAEFSEMKLQTLQEMKKPTSAPKRRDYHSSRVTKDQPFLMDEN
jgi:hypothetical protein